MKFATSAERFWWFLITCNTRSCDVRVEIGFKLRHARRFVFFAAFFMQTHPSAPSLADVIPDIHLQHRADAANHWFSLERQAESMAAKAS